MAAPGPVRQVVRFGAFEVDLRTPELRKNGTRIKLQEQPFQVLTMLLARPGELLSREELQQRLWPDGTFVDFEHSLNTAVKKLREALGDDADNPRFIETVPKRGYRFIAPVTSPPVGQTRWRHTAVLAGLLLVASVVLLWNAVRTPTPSGEIRAIAVLPFENFTGDPTQEYLGGGISDMLTTELAQVKALHVGSFSSASYYKTQRMPLPVIAREFRVQAVVEGSVHRSGDRLLVNVQLIDASTDRNLWAKIYERRVTEYAGLQAQIARDIVAELRLQLTPEDEKRLARRQLVHPEAYEAYLQGLYHLRRGTQADRATARDFLIQAIERDPEYAPAYGQLAILHAHGGGYLAGGPGAARELARQWAAKALELDSSLAEAHAARAWVLQTDWDWQAAEQEFKRAVELNPNLALARTWYAQFLASHGRSEEAFLQANRALELDPEASDVVVHAVIPYYTGGRVDEAITHWRRVVRRDPQFGAAHDYLARGYLVKGMYGEALKAAEAAVAIGAYPIQDRATLAHIYGKTGRKQEARKLLEDLEQRVEKSGRGHNAVAIACLGLDDKDRALAWLEKGYEVRAGAMVGLVSEPLLEPLRDHPRFRNLVQRVGLPNGRLLQPDKR